MNQIEGFYTNKKLTTEAAASLLPPYNMPANTPMSVAVPQFTVPANLCVF